MKKVYLLWIVDPHQDETDVIGVYETKEFAEECRQIEIVKHQKIKDTRGEAWFDFQIEEMELLRR